MENNETLKIYKEGNQVSTISNNLILDSFPIENFAILKKNKLIFLPILLGITIEIVLDLILNPFFEKVMLFEKYPLIPLFLVNMLIVRVFIPIWFLIMLQDTYTKIKSNSNFDSPFQSFRKSLKYIPNILAINLLAVLFEIGLFFLSNLFQGEGLLIENQFLRTIVVLIVFICVIALIIFEIYLFAVYIHWIIISVYDEEKLKRSFKNSLKFVKNNFKKIFNFAFIPILIAIGSSILVEIINMVWINNIILIFDYYLIVFFVALIFGVNYLKSL